MRFQKGLGRELGARRVYGLFKQAHRHAVLLSFAPDLLCIFQWGHAREINNHLVGQFWRRLGRFLPVQLFELLDELVALFFVGHFESSLSTIVSKIRNAACRSRPLWSAHWKKVRSAVAIFSRLIQRPTARHASR